MYRGAKVTDKQQRRPAMFAAAGRDANFSVSAWTLSVTDRCRAGLVINCSIPRLIDCIRCASLVHAAYGRLSGYPSAFTIDARHFCVVNCVASKSVHDDYYPANIKPSFVASTKLLCVDRARVVLRLMTVRGSWCIISHPGQLSLLPSGAENE